MFGEGRSESPRMPSPWLAVSPPGPSTPALATSAGRIPRYSAGGAKDGIEHQPSRRVVSVRERAPHHSSAEPAGARRRSEGSNKDVSSASQGIVSPRSYNLRHEAAQRIFRAQMDDVPSMTRSMTMSSTASSSSPSSRAHPKHNSSPPLPPSYDEPFEHHDDMDAFFSLDFDLELPDAVPAQDVALAIAPPAAEREIKAHQPLANKASARPAALTRVGLSSSLVSSGCTTTTMTSSSTSASESPSPSSSGFDTHSASDSPALTPEKVALAQGGSLEGSIDALAIAMEPDLTLGGDEELFGFLEPDSDSEDDDGEDAAAVSSQRAITIATEVAPTPSAGGPASTSFRHPSSLAPEVDDVGNLEYKLQILPSTRERFDKLVTQMKWRLLQGGGFCVYEVGVLDDGTLVGLDREAMRTSLVHLADMGREMGAQLTIRRVIVVQRQCEQLEDDDDDAGNDNADNDNDGGREEEQILLEDSAGNNPLQSRKERLRSARKEAATNPVLRRYVQRLKDSGRARRGSAQPTEKVPAMPDVATEAETDADAQAEIEEESTAMALLQDDALPLAGFASLDEDCQEEDKQGRRAGKRRRNAARAKQAAALRKANLAANLGNVSEATGAPRRLSSSEGDSGPGDNEAAAIGEMPMLRMMGNAEASHLLATREISRYGKARRAGVPPDCPDMDGVRDQESNEFGAEASYGFGIVDEGPLAEGEGESGLPVGARLIVEAVLSRRLTRNEAFIDFAALP